MGHRENTKQQMNMEQLLSEGNTIQLPFQGYSMYPMLVPGRDYAVIAPANPVTLKKGDVVLYRRRGSILVLHRICKIKGNREAFYFVGDNQIEVEGPLTPQQIKGVLVAFIRNGRTISVNNPIYVITSRVWLWLRPIRRIFQVTMARCKRMIKRK